MDFPLSPLLLRTSLLPCLLCCPPQIRRLVSTPTEMFVNGSALRIPEISWKLLKFVEIRFCILVVGKSERAEEEAKSFELFARGEASRRHRVL